jgi:hypothetical protein
MCLLDHQADERLEGDFSIIPVLLSCWQLLTNDIVTLTRELR